LGSPTVAELLARAGFDWLVIETEHNALDSAEIQHMLMAMNGTDAIPIVRVPSSDPVYIQRALDVGGMGVLVPMIRTSADAQAVVSATRYPPQGTRGFGPLRASHYALDYEDYYCRANDNILVVLILETKESLENLEAIASVTGVDALHLGPFDLCLSLGLNPMQQPHAQIEAALERALAAGKENGVAVGCGAATPEQLRQRIAQGFTFVTYGTDYALMANAVRPGLDLFEQLTGKGGDRK
jgi:2-dehydro-3-deoxyglucarate aldolase